MPPPYGTLDMLMSRSSAVRARLGNDEKISIDYIEACGDCFYMAIEVLAAILCIVRCRIPFTHCAFLSPHSLLGHKHRASSILMLLLSLPLSLLTPPLLLPLLECILALSSEVNAAKTTAFTVYAVRPDCCSAWWLFPTVDSDSSLNVPLVLVILAPPLRSSFPSLAPSCTADLPPLDDRAAPLPARRLAALALPSKLPCSLN
eukprot:6178710-Pleurochrysis_carterae.AAC.1